ncbi:hypothetical protein U1Q18_043777, partial [Sarracenia purpurea var. burkii]
MSGRPRGRPRGSRGTHRQAATWGGRGSAIEAGPNTMDNQTSVFYDDHASAIAACCHSSGALQIEISRHLMGCLPRMLRASSSRSSTK